MPPRPALARLDPPAAADAAAAARVRREELAADGALRVRDAQAFLGLGETEIYQLMKDGTLPYAMVGSGGGRRVIPKAALVKYLADRMTLADAE